VEVVFKYTSLQTFGSAHCEIDFLFSELRPGLFANRERSITKKPKNYEDYLIIHTFNTISMDIYTVKYIIIEKKKTRRGYP
jgi:hypothetical protein